MTLSIAATMIFLAMFLRDRLIADSATSTRDMSNLIETSMQSLMIARNTTMMQDILDDISKSNSLVKAFILDRNGRIAYSSDRREIGRTLDRNSDITCRGCHQTTGVSPTARTVMIDVDGMRVQRNIKVLYNEPACHGCHAKEQRVNGKLIIDRPLKRTYALIASIELIIFGSGMVCLIFLVPFLSTIFSKGIDKYIDKIARQNNELSVLYSLMERLSRTIDLEELKSIVIEIVADTFAADEVDIVIARENKEFSCITWTREENRKKRKKIAETDPMFSAVGEWMHGSFNEEKISADKRRVIIPVNKGNNRLALLDIRKKEAFDPQVLEFVRQVSNHLAVAFENAFLHYLAITDELTKLYTQRHFRYSINRQFEEFEKYGEKFTLLMMDIDNFKTINDTYGHAGGDEVLRDVARHIITSVRDNDLAFRYGGEEFTVILPLTDLAGGKHVAERIRRSIEAAEFEKQLSGVKITISIGVAVCPDHAGSVGGLTLASDKALYRAKTTGKNRVIIAESA